jgi:hypothetical protein
MAGETKFFGAFDLLGASTIRRLFIASRPRNKRKHELAVVKRRQTKNGNNP